MGINWLHWKHLLGRINIDGDEVTQDHGSYLIRMRNYRQGVVYKFSFPESRQDKMANYTVKWR